MTDSFDWDHEWTLACVSDGEGPILMVQCPSEEAARDLIDWFSHLMGTLTTRPDWSTYTAPIDVAQNPVDRDKMAELFYETARREGFTT